MPPDFMVMQWTTQGQLRLNHWNREIERWMDIFSDDEPDPIGLELVRQFDYLTKKFYSIFDDDLNESRADSQLQMSIRSEIFREEVVVVKRDSYSDFRPKQRKVRRKVEPIPVPAKGHIDKTVGSRKDTSEDVVVSDKKIKVVLQLPINNKKENVKVVANDDYSVTISHLNYEGKRCTRTLDIPYDIEFETARATYKNGILEVTFDRQ